MERFGRTHLHRDLLLLCFFKKVESSLRDVAQVRLQLVHLALHDVINCKLRTKRSNHEALVQMFEKKVDQNKPATVLPLFSDAANFSRTAAIRNSKSC